MLNRLIKFSLRNRVLIIVLAFITVIGGCYVASRMETDVFPDLNAPTVAVMTEAPGMACEEVERLVSYPIESALSGTPGVRRIRSNSTEGFSIVWVEFDWDTDVYHARQNVSEKLTTVAGSLPAGVGNPTMGAQTSILGEVMFIGLTSGKATPMELRSIADARIAPALKSIKGVAQVSVIGGDVKEYVIIPDVSRMDTYGVTLSDILDATEGVTRNATGGVVYDFGNEYLVRGMVSTTDPEQIGKAVVKAGAPGAPGVLLENVAEVKLLPLMPATGTASVNGTNAVILTVSKQPGAGTSELTDELDRRVASLRKSMPGDVTMHTDIYRQQNFIDSSVKNIQRSLVEGAVFVCIILFVFLMNPRTTLVSLVTIPLALLMTILVLRIMGLTLNTMSIGGIAIAIGSLVDDAIVDVENVYRHLRHNASLPPENRRKVVDVVFDASREVRMPILNSTCIIIVSFIPLFFLQGMEGRMLIPLGVAFIISLCSSTLVALTLTPVLCSLLLPRKLEGKREPKLVTALKKYYSRALSAALSHSKGVVAVAIVLLLGALALFFSFGRDFMPPFNEGSFTINISAMPGISLEGSDSVGRRAERILSTVPEIKKVARKTGRAELDEHALGVNMSEIEAPFELAGRSREAVVAEIREKLSVIPGVNIEIGQPISHRIDAMLSGTQANIAIKIFGQDPAVMYQIGRRIEDLVKDTEGVADLNVEQQIERPELRLIPRREVMAQYGVTMPQFIAVVEALSGGVKVSDVYDDNMVYDVKVRVPDLGLDAIRDLTVSDQDGRGVPLDQIAEIKSVSGPGAIGRENGERLVVVSANVSGRDMRSVVDEISARIDHGVELPEGYRVEYGGQFESERSASRTLLMASLFSLIAIFMLLYAQFRDFTQSLIVMLNLPLALIGGVAAIWMSSSVISIPAIIGFISLFGIATRNGMLLVDRYNELRRRGEGIDTSVTKGSLDRLNPIIMTALTSALALIPLAAAGSEPGNELQSPMAKVILGGLISSTLLNGFMIPVVYRCVEHRRESKHLKTEKI